MQVGISNMAWSLEDVTKNSELALSLGFDYIESAYTKTSMCNSIYAIQGVFYQSGISSFEDYKCERHIYNVIDYCIDREIKIITLGSSSMRVGDKQKLLNALTNADDYIGDKDCTICIEPNARRYGGEYYYSLDEIVHDIHSFNNIKTMIDTGNLYLEAYDSSEEYDKYKNFICHIHVSTPSLDPVKLFGPYAEFISDLVTFGYNGNVTYEYLYSNDVQQEIKIFLEKVWKNGMEAI